VFSLHQHFTDPGTIERIDGECRSAAIGCVDCKRILAENIAAHFAPVRERARELRAEPGEIRRILDEGAGRARSIARETMRQVREGMGLEWRSAL
jgi:tryptophanyl-tRNA synthetase